MSKKILKKVVFYYDDGQVQTLEGEPAAKWLSALDSMCVIATAHGVQFPAFEWREGKEAVADKLGDFISTVDPKWREKFSEESTPDELIKGFREYLNNNKSAKLGLERLGNKTKEVVKEKLSNPVPKKAKNKKAPPKRKKFSW